ncbi:MAG: helix-hairpin-helix domain-containing protein [Actinobacteria bacterium]|nr:helix-hairpin-helix domain-containing protein [Actinomycetota bacterium]
MSGAAVGGAGPAVGAGAVRASGTGAASSGPVVVDVVGKVRRPGLVRLPAGSRVADAGAAAGGATDAAALPRINLARVLSDGEQVVVPDADDPLPAPPAAPAATSGPGGAARPSGPLDLNTATAADLDELPGVGPVLAGRIVEWRSQHQRFTRVDELAEVAGIGDKVLERLRPLVVV